GIQPGDQIIEIDGRPTLKITVNEAVRRITGPPGETVTLTIKRMGVEKPFAVELKRQEITISTIKGFERKENGDWNYFVDPQLKIGYVRMTNFTEGTIDELQEIVKNLREKQKMRGLIFDLRGNPGGTLNAAVDVSNLFLDGNKKIVSTKDRKGSEWSKSSTGEAKFSDFPLIILIDETTASAAEIVSGALQVYNRALILGERSFGKGSVQQVLPLNKGNAAYLKLTTAHYYLPNGRCLHREDGATTWGVDPDVQIRLVPKEFIKMNELRLKKDILRGKDQQELTEKELNAVTNYSTTKPQSSAEDDLGTDENADNKSTSKPAEADPEVVDESKLSPERKDENLFPNVDPQMEVALTLMRIQIESGQPWPTPDRQIAAKK
ncbi:MAG: S41 family peptidase, partial [Phycisphaerae bacterium]|nr:S41 family peptidase [Phycisphaerae bacterium]